MSPRSQKVTPTANPSPLSHCQIQGWSRVINPFKATATLPVEASR
ncbi:hypothetical protein M2244_000534 [Rhodoferax antarcticus]|nr:hypothetical protein [Rhodoferax antarcticus]